MAAVGSVSHLMLFSGLLGPRHYPYLVEQQNHSGRTQTPNVLRDTGGDDRTLYLVLISVSGQAPFIF